MKLPIEMRQAYLQRRKADLILLNEAVENAEYNFIMRAADMIVRLAEDYGFAPLGKLAEDLAKAAGHCSSTQVEIALKKMQTYLDTDVSI